MPTPKLNMNNQQFAERQKAAQQIKAGQQPTPTGPGALQQQGAQTGTVAQQAQTQSAIQQAGQEVVGAQKQAQMQQIQSQEQRQMDQLTAQKALGDQQRKLEQFAMEIGNDMMAERRDFQTKKGDTAFNNERQLADWTMANAKNEVDLQNRFREMQQASESKIRTLDIIQKRIMLEEERLSKGKMSTETRAMKKKLSIMRQRMEEQKRREAEKARKKGGMFKVATGIAMGVAGAALTFGTGGAAAPVGAGLMAQGTGQALGGASEAGMI
jgi:hypothetical protein